MKKMEKHEVILLREFMEEHCLQWRLSQLILFIIWPRNFLEMREMNILIFDN